MEYSNATIDQAQIIREIMDAVLQGKEVQIHKESNWVNVGEDPDLMLVLAYPCRVKPEPEYIPFTFEDAKDLIGKVVVDKHSIATIDYLDVNGCTVSMTSWTYEAVLERYTFLDGTPCGKLVNKYL
jgi:hypothetical protein